MNTYQSLVLSAVLVLGLPACMSKSATEEKQRAAYLTHEIERNLTLDPILPRILVSETANDVWQKADKPVSRILGKIGASSDGVSRNCRYIEDGVVLLRAKDGRMFRIASADVTRHRGSARVNGYALEPGWNAAVVSLTPDQPDYSRWANFSTVLCPEDGQRYTEAWMKYRFPDLKS